MDEKKAIYPADTFDFPALPSAPAREKAAAPGDEPRSRKGRVAVKLTEELLNAIIERVKTL